MFDEYMMCKYCKFASPLMHSKNEVLCQKKGVVLATEKCRKFDINMLAVAPSPKKKDLGDKASLFTAEDFSIE